ncbi:MAG: hypothetical protein FOGNACKC_04692 [Anaerolineae bacterium]|nr:hypothetical protein [Anaerolineae bacterium]
MVNSSVWVKAAALFAVIFGILTVISGGRVLVSDAAQQAAGDYVGFVLWFNILAGFFYVIAGSSLWAGHSWSVKLALAIAAATLLVLFLFAIHVLTGGAYELRTLVALILRVVVWAGIYLIARRNVELAY